MEKIGIEEIKKIIPHAYPFLFIDRVEEYEKKVKIVAIKNVTINEWFFQGHFPNLSVLPGVVIQECMAQTAAILAGLSMEQPKECMYLFTSCKISYRGIVKPGDQMKICLNVKKLISSGGIFNGEVYVEDKLVAKGELGFAIKPT